RGADDSPSQRELPPLPGRAQLPGPGPGSAGGPVTARGRSPEQIAALLDPGRLPTPEQAAVIGAPLEPLLVVAGAGSGKTETMAHRVLWLLDNHPELREDQVLCLTFTRKAAGEIAERVRERLHSLRAIDARGAAPG